jgi:hypothetical protein
MKCLTERQDHGTHSSFLHYIPHYVWIVTNTLTMIMETSTQTESLCTPAQ